MERLIICLFFLFSGSFIFAQNDTTNDSWESTTAGEVETSESVLMQSYLTFSGENSPRGIRRNNRGFSLDIWGGNTANQGASIILSGDARGGANSIGNGRMEFFSGGDFLSNQASVLGNFDFNTRWSGGEKRLMTLKSSTGRLGIGTSTPSAYLHVKGPPTGYVPGESGVKVEGNYNNYAGVIINNSGGNNAGGLLVETTDGNGLTNALKVVTYRVNGPRTILRVPNAGGGFQNRVLLVEEGGRVGIGTDDPQNALDICGFARAEEIIVQNNWCDFVFNKDYQLPSLAEQKAFIDKNGHLKNFQSEEEMDGQIHVGDVNKRQQQSIEEIMLYLIKIEERVKELEEENALLKSENSKKQ